MTPGRLIAIASLNQFCHWFIIGLFFPIMTLLLLERGLTLFQIGVTIAVYSGTVILLELPTGGLADAIGRKRVYLISLAVFFAAGLGMLIAWNFVMMVIAFFFMGSARALSSGSLDAWFVDEFQRIHPEGNLQPALARIGIFIPLGLGVGSLIGGILPMSLGTLTRQIPGLTRYSGNLIAINLCLIIHFLLTLRLIQEHLPETSESVKFFRGFQQLPVALTTSIQYGVKHPMISLLLSSAVGWGIGVSGLELLWQPQVKTLLGSDSQTWIFGVLSAGYFLASAGGNLSVNPICRIFHHDYPRILLVTRLLMGIGVFLLALQRHLAGFMFVYWGLFVFNGLSNSPNAAIFNSHIPTEQRSTLLSFQSFAEQSGGLLGTLCMGYISEHISIPIAWFFGAEILVLSSLAYVFLPGQKKK